MKILFFVLFSYVPFAQISDALSPVVSTEYGSVRGFNYYTDDGMSTYYFLGIPFAAPPINDLRFAKPQPPKSWTGARNAFAFSPRCIQGPLKVFGAPPAGESEDCLYLNVFAPDQSSSDVGGYPVMVFIHGGSFVSGSSYEYGAVEGILENLVSRGTIVVTIQYRVGLYGFFSLGNDYAPGNYGIWDQLQALKWVNQNIDNFGGDPRRVTIFGESAGAASVSLLGLLPKAQPYFNQSITQSGSALASWVVNDDTLVTSQYITQATGCQSSSGAAVVACMRRLFVAALSTAEFLVYLPAAQQKTTPQIITSFVVWNPVKDGDLIPDIPQNMLKSLSPVKAAMMGTNDNELVVFVRPPPSLQLIPTALVDAVVAQQYYTDAGFEALLKRAIATQFTANSTTGFSQAVTYAKNMYLKSGNVTNQTFMVESFIKLQSDLSMHVPVYQEAKLRADRGGNVWLYNFDFYSSALYGNNYPWRSAFHVLELPYLLKNNLTGSLAWKWDNNDYKLSDLMGKMWTNFAKFGTPTPASAKMAVTWPAFQSNRVNALKIRPDPQVITSFHYSSVFFWNSYLPYLNSFYAAAARTNGTARHR